MNKIMLNAGILLGIFWLFFINLKSQSIESLQTNVVFRTSNNKLQRIFDSAEYKAKWNEADFGDYKVLVEGAGYNNVWLETQPIGGNMYAKRDIRRALDNQLIFMDHQREDGRLPGAISYNSGKTEARFGELQGNFLPEEAFEVYFWIGEDRTYLQKLYNTLKKYDDYLWRTRDSDKNGCLEIWGSGDTGEDHSTRFRDSYHAWMFSFPPTFENLKNLSIEDSITLVEDMVNSAFLADKSKSLKYDSPMPMESMDIMSYSFANRNILYQVSEILQNGEDQYWLEKATEVKNKIRDYLWNEEKHACFDRDKYNHEMPALIHNNLRCMYFGSFSQDMADKFIKHHLLNPEEFWTPMPLPSIAVNDPLFRNIPGNNWSGQPQGLTYQRSIRALENYGYYAELTLIGMKFLNAIGKSYRFTQQFDPFGENTEKSLDGYGPSILTSLEFISRLYGITFIRDKIYWSCLDENHDYYYSQRIGSSVYCLKTEDDTVHCMKNDKLLFSFSKGARIVTDLNGAINEVVGIEDEDK
ncbi:MAG: hypothetical protein IH594_10370, partial [Bacteroidales bacterium]|nr:hypothetical protein [Bacteroidales bacterium]